MQRLRGAQRFMHAARVAVSPCPASAWREAAAGGSRYAV